MSSIRVICEKRSTRWPRDLSRSSSLSSSTILPEWTISRSSLVKGGSSAPSKRYGWLAHLRSCIRMLCMRDRLPLIALSTSMFLVRMFWYQVRCISDMPMSSLISRLGGRSFSTSALSRRSRKGRSSRCSWCSTSSVCPPASSGLNHSSNWSEDEKMSGSRKLSIDHSSCRLFCSGVPVMSSRKWAEKSRTTCDSLPCSFLIRCASSMIR
mmetsp:Transcript_25037/g.80943  ORF Transcript_25037/g.80943 Transcript_25037/m.80943 type:complete len:210 (-) Transcript_25037:923-1552(-)